MLILPALLGELAQRAQVGIGPLQLASLGITPIAYVWFCAHLTGGRMRLRAALRYMLQLQFQAAIEMLGFAACVAGAVTFIYLFAGWAGDPETQVAMRHEASQGGLNVMLALYALSMPAVSMMMTVWRLHALSKKPGALVAAVNGTLCDKAVMVGGDADAAHGELVRHLERLTGPDMPGLGRVLSGSHPRLASRVGKDGNTIHELVWWSCPMKLLVTCHTVEDDCQEVRVRCVLRPAYRLYLIPTPADAVAQMQYIETHLLQPLAAQLAKASAERQRDALRDQAVATQLQILQAQIEPHFLFNTLANVRQLYRSSVSDGESMMDHLIAYLRCAMDDLRVEQSSVVKEMDVAMHYLSIMKIRMGERLSYHFSIAESLQRHPFPPAMLISLVENAIKHGFADSDSGEITMSATRDGQALRVTVADNGAGFSSVGGTGMGLSNIRQRLEAMYGARAWLEVGAPATGGFAATIVIPFEEGNT
jgi:signal transduction histidine kinase